jgi:hypothetical protein
MSFLAGTWHGTTTIQVNPGDPDVPQPSTGAMTWTFEVVPQTNRQTFRATIQSQHAWLPATVLIGSATLTPSNTAPANIGTQGSYASPRGCQATFGSFGIAQVSRIEADFSGVDCDHTTFTGRVVLAKD